MTEVPSLASARTGTLGERHEVAGPAPEERSRAPFLRPVVRVYLASHLILLAVMAGVELRYHETIVGLAQTWDGQWYVQIATLGYPHGLAVDSLLRHPQGPWAFFPGFPLLIRGTADLLHIPAWSAGFLVNLALSFAVLCVVWAYTRTLLGDRLADRRVRVGATLAMALVALCPAGMVMVIPYSEPLFLTAVAGTLLALRRRRPEVAGLGCAVAVLTRPTGLALLAGLLVAVILDRDLGWRRRALSLAPALAALSGYVVYCWLRGGSALMWLHAEAGWSLPDMRYPWGFLLIHGDPVLTHGSVLLALAYPVLGCLLWLGWRHRTELTAGEQVYCAGLLVMFLGATSGPGFRFLLEFLPLLALAGGALWRRPRAVLAVGTLALTVGSVLYLMPGFAFP